MFSALLLPLAAGAADDDEVVLLPQAVRASPATVAAASAALRGEMRRAARLRRVAGGGRVADLLGDVLGKGLTAEPERAAVRSGWQETAPSPPGMRTVQTATGALGGPGVRTAGMQDG